MSAKDFAGLKTFDDWKAKLERLLGDARKASSADDVIAAQKALTEFGIFSPSDVDGMEGLDTIASDACTACGEAAREARIAGLESRVAELRQLAKQIDRQATADLAKASALRAERLRSTLQSVVTAITAATDLEHSVAADLQRGGAADTDQAFADKLTATLDSLIELRNELEQLARPS